MEHLHHKNDIEIKLLPNRRFIYANRKQNIVLTAEHSATEIAVLFPDEYEDYSKRVDFVNSKGKEWTEGLYIPEYKKYKAGFHKTRFHFTLPTEVTTTGELKMQFIAYLPDDTMTTVPFEVIPIDVLDGVLAFKKNARANPDLLILSYNQSSQALFNSQRAVAKSEEAVETSNQAEAQSAEAVETANRTEANLNAEIERATQAESDLQAAIDAESTRAQDAESVVTANLDAEVLRATQAEQTLTDNLAVEAQMREAGDSTNAQAIAEEAIRAIEVESTIAAGLATEISRALSAEALLADAVQAETDRATQVEQAIAADLSAEVGRATAVENVIAADLTAESQRAQAAEESNTQAIQAETDRATAAEGSLAASLAAETARAMTAEQTNTDAIQAEETRALTAEAGLQADINSEVMRAQAAEQLNADAIAVEELRAAQAELALGMRLDTEITASLTEAKQYADQVAEQVRIDGTIYRGTVEESELPAYGENGDLYWISNFNITEPEHSGSAVFNGATGQWDFNIDRYKHQDNDTIVARNSDGALQVADTEEINLTPDTTDFGGSVSLGFKGIMRLFIRKIRGLFQWTSENAAAIATETTRSTTVESALSSDLSAEAIRAKAAEQVNANAIQAETQRATTAENNLSGRISAEEARAQTAENGLSARMTAEETRAKSAEQANGTAIAQEIARAQSAEAGLQSAVATEETRAKAAEQALDSAVAAEGTRAMTAEQALAQQILDTITGVQSDWNQTDSASLGFIKNKPSSLPASDVYSWAKQATKPTYTSNEVGAEPAFSKNTAFNKNFGTAAGTVCESNDARLSNARIPTAHTHGNADLTEIAAWAKAVSKPTYTASEVGAEPAFAKNTAFNKNFGVAAGMVCDGADGRLSNARPASDVSAWAKAASKPTYTASEVGAEPAFTKNTAFNKNFGTASGTVCQGNDSRLSNARTPTAHTHGNADLTEIATWAKAASKPTYTASEVGAEPAFTKNTAFNKNFGTTAGTVCDGADSRLTNSRTPTAHATSATTYGLSTTANYGHVKLSSTDGAATTVTGDAALRYNYATVAAGFDLNAQCYEGRFTLYNIPTDALNFPAGWGTGTSNTAYLEVRRLYSTSVVHQTLFKRGTVQRWVRYSTSATAWSAWTEVDAVTSSLVPNTRTVNGKALSANITLAGGDIGITANANLGSATTVQAALNYIANVFAGTQRVTKLVANNFDT